MFRKKKDSLESDNCIQYCETSLENNFTKYHNYVKHLEVLRLQFVSTNNEYKYLKLWLDTAYEDIITMNSKHGNLTEIYKALWRNHLVETFLEYGNFRESLQLKFIEVRNQCEDLKSNLDAVNEDVALYKSKYVDYLFKPSDVVLQRFLSQEYLEDQKAKRLETLRLKFIEIGSECERLSKCLNEVHERIVFLDSEHVDLIRRHRTLTENSSIKEFLDYAKYQENLQIEFIKNTQIHERSNSCLNHINKDIESLNMQLTKIKEILNNTRLQNERMETERNALDHLSQKLCGLLFQFQCRVLPEEIRNKYMAINESIKDSIISVSYSDTNHDESDSFDSAEMSISEHDTDNKETNFDNNVECELQTLNSDKDEQNPAILNKEADVSPVTFTVPTNKSLNSLNLRGDTDNRLAEKSDADITSEEHDSLVQHKSSSTSSRPELRSECKILLKRIDFGNDDNLGLQPLNSDKDEQNPIIINKETNVSPVTHTASTNKSLDSLNIRGDTDDRVAEKSDADITSVEHDSLVQHKSSSTSSRPELRSECKILLKRIIFGNDVSSKFQPLNSDENEHNPGIVTKEADVSSVTLPVSANQSLDSLNLPCNIDNRFVERSDVALTIEKQDSLVLHKPSSTSSRPELRSECKILLKRINFGNDDNLELQPLNSDKDEHNPVIVNREADIFSVTFSVPSKKSLDSSNFNSESSNASSLLELCSEFKILLKRINFSNDVNLEPQPLNFAEDENNLVTVNKEADVSSVTFSVPSNKSLDSLNFNSKSSRRSTRLELCNGAIPKSQSEITTQTLRHFNCDSCGGSFSNRRNIIKHVKTHSDSSSCHIGKCQESFAVEKVPQKLQSVVVNEETNVSLVTLTVPANKSLDSLNSCYNTGNLVAEKSDPVVTNEEHDSLVQQKSLSLRCDLCNRDYSGVDELNQHKCIPRKEVKTKLFKCSECDKTYARRDVMKMHAFKAHGSDSRHYDCVYCNGRFYRKDRLARHIYIHHSSRGTPYECTQVCESSMSCLNSSSGNIESLLLQPAEAERMSNNAQLRRENMENKENTCGSLLTNQSRTRPEEIREECLAIDDSINDSVICDDVLSNSDTNHEEPDSSYTRSSEIRISDFKILLKRINFGNDVSGEFQPLNSDEDEQNPVIANEEVDVSSVTLPVSPNQSLDSSNLPCNTDNRSAEKSDPAVISEKQDSLVQHKSPSASSRPELRSECKILLKRINFGNDVSSEHQPLNSDKDEHNPVTVNKEADVSSVTLSVPSNKSLGSLNFNPESSSASSRPELRSECKILLKRINFGNDVSSEPQPLNSDKDEHNPVTVNKEADVSSVTFLVPSNKSLGSLNFNPESSSTSSRPELRSECKVLLKRFNFGNDVNLEPLPLNSAEDENNPVIVNKEADVSSVTLSVPANKSLDSLNFNSKSSNASSRLRLRDRIQKHSKSSSYRCGKCQESFTVENNLQKSPKCPNCNTAIENPSKQSAEKFDSTAAGKERGSLMQNKTSGKSNRLESRNRTFQKSQSTTKTLDQSRFECHSCGKLFSGKHSIAVHALTHLKSRSYDCEKCQKSFTVENSLQRSQKCPTCDSVVTKLSDFICNICGQHFAFKNRLNRHKSSLHGGKKRFECSICGKRFARNDSLMEHKFMHSAVRPFKCSVCGMDFKASFHLKKHKKRQHGGQGPYECTICGKLFPRKDYLKVHAALHSSLKPFKCSICDRDFKLSHDLKVHVTRVHKGDVPPSRYCCAHCDKRYSQKSVLFDHINIKHFSGSLEPKKYPCTKCDKSFSWPGFLKTHQISHTTRRPYKCSICKNSYKRRLGRDKHEKKIHGVGVRCRPKLKCSVCGMLFSTKRRLRVHVLLKHPSKQPNKCSFCDKTFKLLGVKRLHERTVHKSEAHFFCAYCNKGLLSKTSIIRHIETQHLPAVKDLFKCTVCNKAFAREDTLKVHKLVHTSRGRFKCSMCDKRFHRRSERAIHEQKAYGKEIVLYFCAHCDEHYLQKKAIIRHLQTQHSRLFKQ